MGIMGDKFVGEFEGMKIELARTNIDKTLAVLVDGHQVASESVALPHEVHLKVEFDHGGKRHALFADSAFKKLFGLVPYDYDYTITIDGKQVTLKKVK
jgi:hypothetical protein